MFPRYSKNLFNLTTQIHKVIVHSDKCHVSKALKQNVRSFGSSMHRYSNYEGDGKTTVSLLNLEYSHHVLISSMSTHGFRLNNGIFAVGPIAVFPRTVLQWNAATVSDITPETLSLFCTLEPNIDILVIGTGDKSAMISKESLTYLKSHKISPEILRTENAIATFNFLNVEGRCVAAALLCPSEVESIPHLKIIDKDMKELESLY